MSNVKMMENIFKAVEQIELADNLMTEALKALEAHAAADCIKYANELLAISPSIEQRLAALYLIDLAAKDALTVSQILSSVYDTKEAK